MSDDGETKDDVKMPAGETSEKITRLFGEGKECSMSLRFLRPTLRWLIKIDVVVLTAMGEEAAIDVKEAPRG